MQPQDRTRDRRTRKTFWIDDRVIDDFAPVMGRYPFGAAALATYAVLARRADREGDSWPSLGLIAAESGTSTSTVKRALRLLELLGLVEIAACYEEGSGRQTSHLYTLLTPPDPLPEVDPDPRQWPGPRRKTYVVRGGNRAHMVPAARVEQGAFPGLGRRQARGVWSGWAAAPGQTPVQADTLPPFSLTPPPVQPDTLPPFSLTPQEGNTEEGDTGKEGTHDERTPFVIAEVGLSNRQVWAAALDELARRGGLGAGDLETWLRPARLVGREGQTLIVGVPNAVVRDRIATRMLPALRAALGATVGVPLDISVVVDG